MRSALHVVLLILLLAACSTQTTQWDPVPFEFGVTILNLQQQPVSGLRVSACPILSDTLPVPPAPAAVEPAGKPIPTHYVLYQNYPNPFNDSTSIELDFPQAGAYTLIMYDLHGHLYDSLGDSNLAGTYTVVWYDTMQTSFMYQCVLTASSASSPVFKDSIYMVAWYAGADHNVMGYTDVDGQLFTHDSLRFPAMLPLSPLVATADTSPDTLGVFFLEDSVLISIADTSTGVTRDFRRALTTGSNTYTLTWNP